MNNVGTKYGCASCRRPRESNGKPLCRLSGCAGFPPMNSATFSFFCIAAFKLALGQLTLNLLKTKRRPLYLKTQFVLRCKHSS